MERDLAKPDTELTSRFGGNTQADSSEEKTMKSRMIIAALTLAIAASGSLALAGPASAKSCKWSAISYDPITHITVVACVGRNRP